MPGRLRRSPHVEGRIAQDPEHRGARRARADERAAPHRQRRDRRIAAGADRRRHRRRRARPQHGVHLRGRRAGADGRADPQHRRARRRRRAGAARDRGQARAPLSPARHAGPGADGDVGARHGARGTPSPAPTSCRWSRLLGGTAKPVRPYGAVGYDGVAGSAKAAEAWAKRGFAGIKAKIGYPTVGEDVAVVRAMRDAAGAAMAIMVDYNQCLAPAEAEARLRVLDDEGLTWVEEPTLLPRPRRQRAGRARARRRRSSAARTGGAAPTCSTPSTPKPPTSSCPTS